MLSIYYSKSSGDIYTVTQAPNKQGYERFGEFAGDMSLILDIIYTEDNEYVMMNNKLFKVENGEVKLKADKFNINNL